MSHQQSRTFTFNDDQVATLVRTLGNFLEGRLARLDAARPNMNYYARWDYTLSSALLFVILVLLALKDIMMNAGSAAPENEQD